VWLNGQAKWILERAWLQFNVDAMFEAVFDLAVWSRRFRIKACACLVTLLEVGLGTVLMRRAESGSIIVGLESFEF